MIFKELKLLLTIGEKYKKECEKMGDEFWKEHGRKEFENLLLKYKESLDTMSGGNYENRFKRVCDNGC